jgi:hypothetical protein
LKASQALKQTLDVGNLSGWEGGLAPALSASLEFIIPFAASQS